MKLKLAQHDSAQHPADAATAGVQVQTGVMKSTDASGYQLEQACLHVTGCRSHSALQVHAKFQVGTA